MFIGGEAFQIFGVLKLCLGGALLQLWSIGQWQMRRLEQRLKSIFNPFRSHVYVQSSDLGKADGFGPR